MTNRLLKKRTQVVLPTIMPRPYQLSAWHALDNGVKNIIISYPRRHGKDLQSLSMAVNYALTHPNSSVVLLLPTRTWAKKVYWKPGQEIESINPITGEVTILKGSMLDVCIPKQFIKSKNETEGVYKLSNGSTISLQGSDTEEFVGQRINFLLISEVAQHKPKIFPLLSPVLEESNGITVYNGTVTSESNHLWQWIIGNKDLDNWHVEYQTLADTETAYYLPPVDENGKRDLVVNAHLKGEINPLNGRPYTNIYDKIIAGDSKSMVQREYLNVPRDVEEGSFYADSIAKLRAQFSIGDHIQIDPKKYVHCALDIGKRDQTVIVWFQVDATNKALTFIEAYGNTGQEIGHYIEVIRSRPYKQGLAFAPHDANKSNMVSHMNILTLAKEEYDFDFMRLKQSKSTLSDINVVRNYLERAQFKATPCLTLLKHLDSYHAKADGTPKHDLSSDWCDALRYAILAVDRGFVNDETVRAQMAPRSSRPNQIEINTPAPSRRYVNRNEVTVIEL